MGTRRDKQLTHQQFDEINRLYWEEGHHQHDLAEMYGVSQSHISRIVNSIACSYHCLITNKIRRLEENIVPSKDEHKNAKTLRAKRETLHSTKLSWEKVSRMRKLYFTGRYTEMELAVLFGVNQSTVSLAIQGKNWKKQ